MSSRKLRSSDFASLLSIMARSECVEVVFVGEEDEEGLEGGV